MGQIFSQHGLSQLTTMQSFFGISHRDYPNDPEGFMRALNRLDWLPYLGFVVPPLLMIATNGFQIYEWKKGEPFPEPWFAWVMLFFTILLCVILIMSRAVLTEHKKILQKWKQDRSRDYYHALFIVNTKRSWTLLYRRLMLGTAALAVLYFNFGWGVTFLIYFFIGRL